MDFDDIKDMFSGIADIPAESLVVIFVFFIFSIIIWGSRLFNTMLNLKTVLMMQGGGFLALIACIIYFQVKS